MRYLIMLLSMYISIFALDAGVIYHWKDELGITHYTDNLGTVPDQFRGNSERHLPEYASLKEPILSQEDRGAALWKNECKSCHYIEEELNNEGLVSLSSLLVDSQSGRINEVQLVVIGIDYVLSNTHSSIVKQKLSDAEVAVLSKQLLDLQQEALQNDPESN